MQSFKIISIILCFFALFSCGEKQMAKAPTKKITATKTDTSSHLVGMWYDEEIKTEKGEHIAYQIVSKGDKTFIQVVTFTEEKLDVNDSPTIAPSASPIKKSGNRYVSMDNTGQSYLVDSEGDLLIYDGSGFIAKCKKLL